MSTFVLAFPAAFVYEKTTIFLDDGLYGIIS